MKNNILRNFSMFLEAFGLGLSWEYYNKRIPIYNHWKQTYDRGVVMTFRRSKYTDNLYYRTMRPGCNGFDDNEWVYCKDDNIKLEMGNKL